MAYGDPSAALVTGIQTGGLGAPITPNNFYRVQSAGPFPGTRAYAEDIRTNTGNLDLPGKADKVTVQFEIVQPLTVLGGIKEFASCIGAVSSAQQGGTAAYKHTLTFSRTAANTRYFTVEADIDGRVYTITDVRVHGMRIEAAEGAEFPIMTLRCVGTWVTSAQFFPTGTHTSYDGIDYVYGIPKSTSAFGADASADTWNVDVVAGGAIDGSTATVRTQLNGDAGWSTTRAPYNDVPFAIRDENEDDSGLSVIWGVGGGNNSLNGADSFTVSSRGTATSGTILEPSLLSWNSVEAEILLNDSVSFQPISFFVDLDLNLKTDLFVGGREVPLRFPPQGPARFECGFQVWSQTAKEIHEAWNNDQKSFRVKFVGNEIATTSYFEEFDITISQFRPTPIDEMLDGNFLRFRDLVGKAHDSDASSTDAFQFDVTNNLTALTS